MLFEIPELCKKIIVTGGAGFIGGHLVRKLLSHSKCQIFNIDKLGYASDLTSINNEIKQHSGLLGSRHNIIKIDISNKEILSKTFKEIDPDFVFHLAAESHVDKSIEGPEVFLKSNVLGTYNLLEISREHFKNLSKKRKKIFRFHHVSTDEVFGSLDDKSKFSEKSPYKPNSPYSASKAASDHFVRAWRSTYGLPISISNCSNNFGPWQLPDKLIPLAIYKAINNELIPIYGNGQNIRDWLFVEDHVEAILNVAFKGLEGSTYCIGGCNEYSNLQVVKLICDYLNEEVPKKNNYREQISFVKDRPGHDFRYAIDNTLICSDLGWQPRYSFEEGLRTTISWYLENINWCKKFI